MGFTAPAGAAASDFEKALGLLVAFGQGESVMADHLKQMQVIAEETRKSEEYALGERRTLAEERVKLDADTLSRTNAIVGREAAVKVDEDRVANQLASIDTETATLNAGRDALAKAQIEFEALKAQHIETNLARLAEIRTQSDEVTRLATAVNQQAAELQTARDALEAEKVQFAADKAQLAAFVGKLGG